MRMRVTPIATLLVILVTVSAQADEHVWEHDWGALATNRDELNALTSMLELFPQWSFDVHFGKPAKLSSANYSGGIVEVDGNLIKIDVSKEIANFMHQNRLIAYLIVKELVELWMVFGDHEHVVLEMHFAERGTEGKTLFAMGETSGAAVKVTMSK